ncbi:MAG: alpha/beta hydrolase [Pirellulales bacterium]
MVHSLCRFGWMLALAACLAGAAVVGAAPPDSVTWQEGIEYAAPGGESLRLNLAMPREGSGPLPAVVCIHGGGFRAGKREALDALCKTLAERGYVAVTVSYRLAPAHPFPAAVHDVKAAVRWLRAHADMYRVDPARIGALGYSAGGSLAQLLGVTAHVPRFEGDGGNLDQRSDVACVVNIYGANDFTKSYGRSKDAHEVLPLWFGGDLSTHRGRHIEGSSLYWVTPDSAPTRCIHGTVDDHVALEQSQWLVERLQAATVPADLVVLEGAGHGFKGPDAEKAERAIVEFLDSRLKAK